MRRSRIAAVTLTNANGRRKRPLAELDRSTPRSSSWPRVLDEAVRRKLVAGNAARAKGLRLKEQRSRGNVLEVDELEDLLAAAAEIDHKVTPKVLRRAAHTARALRDPGSGVEARSVGA